jgi:hypothetical protein
MLTVDAFAPTPHECLRHDERGLPGSGALLRQQDSFAERGLASSDCFDAIFGLKQKRAQASSSASLRNF